MATKDIQHVLEESNEATKSARFKKMKGFYKLEPSLSLLSAT